MQHESTNPVSLKNQCQGYCSCVSLASEQSRNKQRNYFFPTSSPVMVVYRRYCLTRTQASWLYKENMPQIHYSRIISGHSSIKGLLERKYLQRRGGKTLSDNLNWHNWDTNLVSVVHPLRIFSVHLTWPTSIMTHLLEYRARRFFFC